MVKKTLMRKVIIADYYDKHNNNNINYQLCITLPLFFSQVPD